MTVIEKTTQQMQEKIIQQEWKPGVRLPSEAELCRVFGVSRATIRSCIQYFCQMGVMETVNGSGTFLRANSEGIPLEQCVNLIRVDNESLLYMLEIRLPLEMQAAFIAATRRTSDQLTELKGILDRLLQTRDVVSFAEMDELFHHKMVEMSKNPIMVRLYNTLQAYTTQAFLEQTLLSFKAPEKLDYGSHLRIYEAIRDGQSDLARQICSRHIQTTIDRVRKQMIEI